MRAAGVLLAPRTDEAFGLSVVEAMARGLPVVAAGSGAHLETVGSVPGAALFRAGRRRRRRAAAARAGRLAGEARDATAPGSRSSSASGSPWSSRPAAPTRVYRELSVTGPGRRLARGLGRRLATQPAPGLAAARGRPRPPRAVRRAARRPAARRRVAGRGARRGLGLPPGRRGPAVAVPTHQVAPPQARPGGRRAAVVGRRAGGRAGGHDPAGAVAQRPAGRRPPAPDRLARALRHHRRLAAGRPLAARARPARRRASATCSTTAARWSSARPGCWRPSHGRPSG